MSKKYVTFKAFKHKCINFCEMNSFHNMDYFNASVVRYYNTYKFIVSTVECIGERIKLLSIGAGGAFVEAYLQKYENFDCTILDFPEEISINEGYYKKLGFKTISADVTDVGINSEIDGLFETYDIIISLENIEHIPDAPSNYMRRFIPYLKSGGIFCISTLNIAGINRIMHLVLMMPFFADPEKFFGPTCFENEGVHRREYMACEIEREMEKVGLGEFKVKYTNNTSMFLDVKKFFLSLITFIPRFRISFIVMGKFIKNS